MSTTSPSPDVNDGPVGSRRGRRLEPAPIALLALTLNLAGNGRVSLWDRDEPRYAGCVREMRARGDWIHPTFNAEPRYHKPILIYWLMRAGFALGGDNPFGARLVSALAGAATCLVTWALGRRMLGPRAGRLGADAGDGADHGRRVEAGDDRRHADALAGRRPVLPLGAGAAAFGRVRGGVLGADGAGVPDQGAGRAGPDRRRGAGLLVVGRADRVLAAAPLALGAAPLRCS